MGTGSLANWPYPSQTTTSPAITPQDRRYPGKVLMIAGITTAGLTPFTSSNSTTASMANQIASIALQRVCLPISHRALHRCISDRIVVIDNGSIEEAGIYDQLIHRKGVFAQLRESYYEEKNSVDMRMTERI